MPLPRHLRCQVGVSRETSFYLCSLVFNVRFQHLQRSTSGGHNAIRRRPQYGFPVCLSNAFKFFSEATRGNGLKVVHEIAWAYARWNLDESMNVVKLSIMRKACCPPPLACGPDDLATTLQNYWCKHLSPVLRHQNQVKYDSVYCVIGRRKFLRCH